MYGRTLASEMERHTALDKAKAPDKFDAQRVTAKAITADAGEQNVRR